MKSKNNIAGIIIVFILFGFLSVGVSLTKIDKKKMSTSINSFWSVELSSIEAKGTNDKAYDQGSSVSDEQIIIRPYLEGKNSKVEYLVNVKNKGTIDALLENIKIMNYKDEVNIEFENISIGDTLERNSSKIFKIIVTNKTDDIESNYIMIELDYAKK